MIATGVLANSDFQQILVQRKRVKVILKTHKVDIPEPTKNDYTTSSKYILQYIDIFDVEKTNETDLSIEICYDYTTILFIDIKLFGYC